MNLFATFEQIKVNKVQAEYTVSPIPEIEGAYIGLDKEDRPCIFIFVRQEDILPSIRTSQIKVEFFKKHKLIMKQGIEKEGIFHSIQCLSNDQIDIIITAVSN